MIQCSRGAFWNEKFINSYILVVVLITTPHFALAEEKSPYEIPEKLTEEEKRDGPYLSGASVYPEWGVPCTKFTYIVFYQDEKGRAPTYVRIHLNGEWHDMENAGGDPGEAWCNGNDKDGRTYIISLSACDTAGNETTVRDTLALGADKTAKARDRW